MVRPPQENPDGCEEAQEQLAAIRGIKAQISDLALKKDAELQKAKAVEALREEKTKLRDALRGQEEQLVVDVQGLAAAFAKEKEESARRIQGLLDEQSTIAGDLHAVEEQVKGLDTEIAGKQCSSCLSIIVLT